MAATSPSLHTGAVTAARAAAFLAKHVERALSTVDLTPPQYRFLVLLGSGRVSPAQAAEMLAVRPPSVTAIVDNMVARGLVEREEVAADRRRVTISITSSGSEALQQGDQAIAVHLSQVASHGHSSEDAASSIEALARWAADLDAFHSANRLS